MKPNCLSARFVATFGTQSVNYSLPLMITQDLQQNFFKEMMSVFQDMVDRQTEKLSDDAGKVNLLSLLLIFI